MILFIALHSFDNPEREEYEEIIDIEMKYNLLSYSFKGITDIELKLMEKFRGIHKIEQH